MGADRLHRRPRIRRKSFGELMFVGSLSTYVFPVSPRADMSFVVDDSEAEDAEKICCSKCERQLLY